MLFGSTTILYRIVAFNRTTLVKFDSDRTSDRMSSSPWHTSLHMIYLVLNSIPHMIDDPSGLQAMHLLCHFTTVISG